MTSPTTEDILLVGAVAAGATLLAGCGSGGGGGEDSPSSPPAKNTITALTVKASGTPVTVNAVDGGAAGVRFNLGGDSGRVLPGDPGAGGAARIYTFTAAPTATPGSVETLMVVVNPVPEDVLAALGSSSLSSTRDSIARMGFPPSWDELMSHAGMTHDQIVDRAIARLSGEPAEPYPSWIDGTILSWSQYSALPPAERDAIQKRKYPRRQQFKGWWFRQMVTSPDALGERLLLFWHNLFTSSATSLDNPELIARQHRLYRQRMTGNFRTFVKDMSRDPGMCEYLDSARNSAKDGSGNPIVPNENFARELLELFTLGEAAKFGGYVENDVKELAHFFTGYHLDYERGSAFAFNVAKHDTDDKPLFGAVRTGTAPSGGYAKDGDWAIDRILLKQDGGGKSYCARYIVTRLWREFIGTPADGDAPAIQALADGFAATWELVPLYRAFFKSAAFKSPSRKGARIRSPVELWVGFYRPLGRTPDRGWEDHLWTFYSLDQDLLDPPNVFGWSGNESWINLKTVTDRAQRLSWMTWGPAVKNLPSEMEPVVPLLLMARDAVDPPYNPATDWRGRYAYTRVARFLIDPAYNLG